MVFSVPVVARVQFDGYIQTPGKRAKGRAAANRVELRFTAMLFAELST